MFCPLRRLLLLPWRPSPLTLMLLLMLIEADAGGTDIDMGMDALRSALAMYACTNPADVMMGGSLLANCWLKCCAIAL
jgi:hypothetical protein